MFCQLSFMKQIYTDKLKANVILNFSFLQI